EVVVTKTLEGEIVAVTRQDDEGRILSVIAEADSKRRGVNSTHTLGEPVAGGLRLVPQDPTSEMLDAAERLDWSNEDVRGNCCNMWYVMLAAVPQPAEPVKQETMTARELADRVARGEKWKIA